MNKEEGTKEKSTVVQYGLEMTEERIPSIVREASYEAETDIFNNPPVIVDFCRQALRLDRQCEEHLYLMCLNTKGRVQGLFEMSHGTMSQTFCGLKEMAVRILLCGGNSIVVLHNHPSGDPTPSMEDERMAERIAKASGLLDVKLLDFIIVGSSDYYSFAEHREIEE